MSKITLYEPHDDMMGNWYALSWDLFCSIQKIEMLIRCR